MQAYCKDQPIIGPGNKNPPLRDAREGNSMIRFPMQTSQGYRETLTFTVIRPVSGMGGEIDFQCTLDLLSRPQMGLSFRQSEQP